MTDSKIDYRISLNETNVLKGIAICAMLCHHLFFENPEYGNFTHMLALTGKVCVALFVFLSGYGMAVQYRTRVVECDQLVQGEKYCSYLKKMLNRLRFLMRRFLKFYLNYWFVFLITVPLGVFVFGRTLASVYGTEFPIWSSLLEDVFGLRVFGSYNITWWVNRLFLALWLFFPFLYWSLNSKFVSAWMMILLLFDPGSILYPLKFVAFGLSIWILPFAIGIFLAVNGDSINKILNKMNRYVVLAVFTVAALAFLYMRNNYVFSCFLGVKGDPFIVVFLSFAVVCICRLTHRKMSALAFVGKHSMNMYLMHTFIYAYFFHNFIYGFKYPILIFAALFSISLLLSMIVEFMKNRLKFYQFQQKVCSFLTV